MSEHKTLPPRIIEGLQAQYEEAAWPGFNSSGLRPFGKHVLIKVDKCAQTRASGIQLPAEKVDQMTEASETGVIFAIGPAAFRVYEDLRPWDGDKPKEGERIYFQRYAGHYVVGADGERYRIMPYGCIVGGYSLEELAAREQGGAS